MNQFQEKYIILTDGLLIVCGFRTSYKILEKTNDQFQEKCVTNRQTVGCLWISNLMQNFRETNEPIPRKVHYTNRRTFDRL